MSNEIEDFWNKLKTQRDEMRLQTHLAQAEFLEEWEGVEKKWQKAEQKLKRIQDHAVETTAEMQRSATVSMEEIANTYDRIKARLKD